MHTKTNRNTHRHKHRHTHTCKHRNIKIFKLNKISTKQIQYKYLDLIAYSQLKELAKLLRR